MNQTQQETNKALVLEAFDTLFNKRDYAAAERYWSPTTSNTALISDRVAMVCSISSRAFGQR
jgi:predicted SnoaL-like aldol condensation-catalyzing enzyme